MKKLSALLLTVGAALTLCSCGGSRGNTEAEAPTPTPAPTPAPVAEEEVRVDPRPALMRVITEKCADLDPAAIRRDGKNCLLEIYEPLFALNADGKTEAVLADGNRGEFGGYDHTAGSGDYTVYLRQGVTDHDGNPLGAADAAFCVRRLAEAEGWTLFSSAESGEDGSLTLSFTRELNAPGEWEEYFTALYLYTESAFNAHGSLLDAACGTGPYLLSSRSEEEMTLLPHDAYWQGEERMRRSEANVQSIVYLFPETPAERVIALEVGRADMADCLDYDDTIDFRDGGSYADLFRVEGSWSREHYFLIPNFNYKSKLKDQNLRSGLFYAIDNTLLADFDGIGGARGCTAPANPDCADVAQDAESYESVTKDVNEVRYLVRQASYVNEGIKFITPSGGKDEQLACTIQTMLRPLSINLNVMAMGEETFTATMNDPEAWELALIRVEGSSAAEVWKKLWTDRLNGNNYPGSLNDGAFRELLSRIAVEKDCTAENMNAAAEYITSHAYAMALVQLRSAAVVPVKVSEAYLTGSGALLPGACLYE